MKFSHVLAASFLLFLSCGSSSVSGPPPGEADLRVLLIGNSLTSWNDMPGILDAMFDSSGVDAYIESVARDNFGLQDHWDFSPALDRIRAGGWDVVMMQQGPSATEGRPSLIEWSARFADSIRAVGAVPAMYMVWPAENRFFDFPGVADSYRTAAENIDGKLFPVGQAWQLVWQQDSTVGLYGPDRFHPSILASYLAAATILAGLSEIDPLTLPDGIRASGGSRFTFSARLGNVLRGAAAEANRRFGR